MKRRKGRQRGKTNGKGVFSFLLLFPPSDSLKPSPQQGAKNTENKADSTTIKTYSQSSTSSLCASSLLTSSYVMSSNYFVCSSLAILHL